jgi:ribosomal protein S18 acetylase RimI-like enzyme
VLPLLSEDAWILDETVESDIDLLMKWFPDADTTRIWGGPDFRHPFNRHSFAEDIHWGRMATFSLRSPAGEFAAFGQLYERLKRINLARLVVNPSMRAQGIGKRLIEALMTLGPQMFSCTEFSLFVYRDNVVAAKIYESMGFKITSYPDKAVLGEVCDYLTRPVAKLERQHAP